MEDRGIGIRLPAGAKDFSLLQIVHTISGVHPEFFPMLIASSFPDGEEFTSAWYRT
jgi:hypothetical protein